MPFSLIVATNNAHKLQEIKQILGPDLPVQLYRTSDLPDHTPPEETGSTFEENARIKAEYYASRFGLTAIGDDSGLEVDALDGRPGIYSSRYADSDQARISRLLGELEGVPESQRSARFRCAICIAAPDRILAEQQGAIEGHIAFEPKGTNGFGYDPVFVVAPDGPHLAEMTEEGKNGISHRGAALKKILPELRAIIARASAE